MPVCSLTGTVNVRSLRRDAPEWEWTARRKGAGWEYIGTNGGRRVVVSTVGVIVGPSDDDVAMQWVADDGCTLRQLSWWILRYSRRQ